MDYEIEELAFTAESCCPKPCGAEEDCEEVKVYRSICKRGTGFCSGRAPCGRIVRISWTPPDGDTT